jgi:hypothetical protein
VRGFSNRVTLENARFARAGANFGTRSNPFQTVVNGSENRTSTLVDVLDVALWIFALLSRRAAHNDLTTRTPLQSFLLDGQPEEQQEHPSERLLFL